MNSAEEQTRYENEESADQPKKTLFRRLDKRWKARLIVCLIMLILGFIGLLIMDLHAKSYWVYSRLMAVIYALCSIWLYWYLHRKDHKPIGHTVWHQLLHWIGLIVAIYIISIFVNTGLIGSVQAGLVTLTLLALTIFLAGVYTSASFIFIGIMLGIFAVTAALIQAYLSIIMIPVILLTALIIYLIHHYDAKKVASS